MRSPARNASWTSRPTRASARERSGGASAEISRSASPRSTRAASARRRAGRSSGPSTARRRTRQPPASREATHAARPPRASRAVPSARSPPSGRESERSTSSGPSARGSASRTPRSAIAPGATRPERSARVDAATRSHPTSRPGRPACGGTWTGPARRRKRQSTDTSPTVAPGKRSTSARDRRSRSRASTAGVETAASAAAQPRAASARRPPPIRAARARRTRAVPPPSGSAVTVTGAVFTPSGRPRQRARGPLKWGSARLPRASLRFAEGACAPPRPLLAPGQPHPAAPALAYPWNPPRSCSPGGSLIRLPLRSPAQAGTRPLQTGTRHAA